MSIASVGNWWFRSRITDQIVVAEVPNPALATWLIATLWRAVAQPEGAARTMLDGIATGALIVWALDEVVRGVNPFRRALGAVVLIPTLISAVMRIS